MFRTRMRPVVRFAEQCLSGDLRTMEFEDIRPQAWRDTVTMIAERPTFGFGPGNYELVYEKYRQRVKNVRVVMVHAHNEYLELLAEYGLVGGLLALGVALSVSIQLIRFICTSPRTYHALPAAALLGALAGTAVHGMFDFELRIFPNALMLAFLAGCAVAPQVQLKREQPASSIRKKGMAVFNTLFSVLTLVAAAGSAQVMSSAWIRSRGDQLLEREQLSPAEQHFKTAQRIDSQNWRAQWGLGQIYYTRRYNELDPELRHQWALK